MSFVNSQILRLLCVLIDIKLVKLRFSHTVRKNYVIGAVLAVVQSTE